jgi:hypothetical protein
MLPLVAFLFTANAPAQTVAAQSDPQAIALANQALVTLTGGNPIADAVLSGTVIRIVGGDRQTGNVTLKVKGTAESRIDLALSSTSSEVRNDPSGQSFWFGSDQTWHPMASHNCMTDTAWFFPALSSLASVSNPAVLFTYVGQETHDRMTVQHIRVSRPASDPLFTHLSTMDFYLDSSSLLPLSVSFALHPDSDAGRDIRTEIRFANYQNVSGLRVPFRIQKLVQGSLLLDLTVTSAAVNTGLQDSDFTVAAQ